MRDRRTTPAELAELAEARALLRAGLAAAVARWPHLRGSLTPHDAEALAEGAADTPTDTSTKDTDA